MKNKKAGRRSAPHVGENGGLFCYIGAYVAYAILRIASDRRYKDKAGNRLTDFISIKVRGPLAERCAEFAWKGCKLAASGDFETITFEGEPERQPGFLIKASEVEFLSPRKVEETAQELEDESVREVAA